MYEETIAVCCEDNTEWVSTLYEQNAVFSVKSVGTYDKAHVFNAVCRTFSVVIIIRQRNLRSDEITGFDEAECFLKRFSVAMYTKDRL